MAEVVGLSGAPQKTDRPGVKRRTLSDWLSAYSFIAPYVIVLVVFTLIAVIYAFYLSFFKVDIGNGTVLDGWMIKPPGFDPSKKYPIIFYVYGEPAGTTVMDNWGGTNYLWYLMLAQQGYIVASVDNRGTPVSRGRQWRKIVYRKIGVISSADQDAAV